MSIQGSIQGKQAAIYCRASVPAQTIEAQRLSLLNFAKDNGFENVAEYIDNGKSGLTLDRPALNQLTADMCAGKIEKVFVIAGSRIGKGDKTPTSEALEWIDKANALGVEIVSKANDIPSAEELSRLLRYRKLGLFTEPQLELDILFSIEVDFLPQSASIDDAIKDWLEANGHEWDYDQDGQLRANIDGVLGHPTHIGGGDIEWLPILTDDNDAKSEE